MLADVVRWVSRVARAEPPAAATVAFLERHRVAPRIAETLGAPLIHSATAADIGLDFE